MAKLKILVVEDDPLARKVMTAQLGEHSVEFAPDEATARRKLESGKYDLGFIDLELGKDDGCSGLKLIPLAVSKGIYSVVMSGHDSEKFVEQAYELGCHDFYAKGNEADNVGRVIARFLERRDKTEEERLFSESFVTEDEGTRAAIREALKYASSELPMLILGPSGSGKTSLARIIHSHSHRPGDFVAINCAAYTEDLLEAELFGYRRGAFTGASDARKGKLLLADRGTLFLDEIGSMSLAMQTKLLKAIEERSFYPLGSERPESSQFRIVSATLENLQELIKAGRLRFDFFQRIHGLPVHLKPLAERRGDILPMIAHFTRGGKRLSFTAEAKEQLIGHAWPGNIRELKRFVDLLVAGHDGGRVSLETVDHLLAGISAEPNGGATAKAGSDAVLEKFIHDVNSKSSSLKSAAALLRGAPDNETREMLGMMNEQAQKLAQTVADFERKRGV